MKRYTIQTGDYKTEQVADDIEAAVVAAFKRRAPKNPGMLTRAKASGVSWHYISTEAMLRKAGYTVRV